jgi:hypothetical protein
VFACVFGGALAIGLRYNRHALPELIPLAL